MIEKIEIWWYINLNKQPKQVKTNQNTSLGVKEMLAEERHAMIEEIVNRNKSVSISELCQMLNSSVSTIRRDLNTLAEQGKLIKVHGGAISKNEKFTFHEENIKEKERLYTEEKIAIAKYAASLVEEGDFVFLDAGTTTEKMIEFLPQKNVTFVTNAFIHTKKLAERGFKVYIPGGEIKLSTEAIVGVECVMTLSNYHFTKSFLGVNGISVSGGFSTPDINEAKVKSTVISTSINAYVLADHSKFDRIATATFSPLNKATIITDRLIDCSYMDYTLVKEVMKDDLYRNI